MWALVNLHSACFSLGAAGEGRGQSSAGEEWDRVVGLV